MRIMVIEITRRVRLVIHFSREPLLKQKCGCFAECSQVWQHTHQIGVLRHDTIQQFQVKTNRGLQLTWYL